MRLVREGMRWIAGAIWSAAGVAMRLALRLWPAREGQRHATERLREDVRALPEIAAGGQVEGAWASNRRRLREHLRQRDPRAFLTWDVIRETMFLPPYAECARAELKWLKEHAGAQWRRVVVERMAGLPFPCLFYPRSSSNAIHHAYHLFRFEVETGLKLPNFQTIIEFGGGYGSLCRIARAIGFAGTYVIFDLPEQSALQRYYLAAIGVRDVRTVSEIDELTMAGGAKLFVATWSLSESPVALRKQVFERVRDFEGFLIAFQREFGGVDNHAFFRDWQSWLPGVRWTSYEIGHIRESTYLFGVRSASARDKGSAAEVMHTGLGNA